MIRYNLILHTRARAVSLPILLALLFLSSFAATVHAQQIIDDKLVGGPKDQTGHFENPSKFVIANNDFMFVTCPNGVFKSDDRGVSWSPLTSSSIADFCFDANNTLYLADDSGVFSSTDYGQTLTNLNGQLPNGPFSTVVVAPNGTIFTGCKSGVFRSTDGGMNWDHKAQTEIPFGASPLCVMVTPKGTILARNGNSYFRSTDNGDSWATSVPLTIQIWPVTPDNILRQSDNGLERSTDDGVSWHSVPSSPQGLLFDLAMDQAGDLFTFYAYDLYISKDSGTTWSVDCIITGGGQELGFTQDHTLFFFRQSEGLLRTLKPLSGVEATLERPDILLQLMLSNANGQNLSFTLPTRESATLTLYNILGEKVMTLAESEFEEGEHRISLPSNLATGSYICVLRSNGEVKVLKVLR